MQATLHQNAGDSAIRVGEWDWAVGIVEPLLATELELTDLSALKGVMLVILALRGEVTEADLEEHEAALEGNADRQIGVTKRVPRLQADYASGRWDDIERRCLELLSMDRIGGTAHVFLAGRVALWRRDAAALRRLIDLHEGLRVHGDAISVERIILRAGFAALAGRAAEAHAGYREAIESWRDLGLDWEEALAGLDMATVLDRDLPDVAAAIVRSGEIFERLRARPFLERLLLPTGAAPGATDAASPRSIAVSASPTFASD